MGRRGRPRKDPDRLLVQKAEMRMTVDEHARLERLWKSSAAPSRSEFLRNLVFGYRLRSRTDADTAAQLSRIGSNLNQIARKLNSGLVVNGQDLVEQHAALNAHVMELIRSL